METALDRYVQKLCRGVAVEKARHADWDDRTANTYVYTQLMSDPDAYSDNYEEQVTRYAHNVHDRSRGQKYATCLSCKHMMSSVNTDDDFVAGWCKARGGQR